jgi:N-formylglutamate amidohydrolase
MTLPFLLSVPHAGWAIPVEVKEICLLSRQEIIEDGDGGAAEIYLPLKKHVAALVSTPIARAIVDMNRSEDDRRKDGVIKSHTCWNVPVYNRPPTEKIIGVLLEKYHRPYHQNISHLSRGKKLGIDCHTMAEIGPPVGPDSGLRRPRICLGNGDGTCPRGWIESFAQCFSNAFKTEVSINHPFKGGYIIRSHTKEIPWIQIELSRENFLSLEKKSVCLLDALTAWHQKGHVSAR